MEDNHAEAGASSPPIAGLDTHSEEVLAAQCLPPRYYVEGEVDRLISPAFLLNFSKDGMQSRFWSKKEDDVLQDITKQPLLGTADATKEVLPTEAICSSVSTELKQLGLQRSIGSCRMRWQRLQSQFAGRASIKITKVITDAIPTPLPAYRPKRTLLGRDEYVDSGTISFTSGIHRSQQAKKPRTMSESKSATRVDGGERASEVSNAHNTSKVLVPYANGNRLSNATMRKSFPNTQTTTGLQPRDHTAITPNMAAQQIELLDNGIKDLKATKESLTTKIAEYESLLKAARLLPGMIQNMQQEVAGLENKIVAKENGKEALLTYVAAVGDSDQT